VRTPLFQSGDAPSRGPRRLQRGLEQTASTFIHQYVIYTQRALRKIASITKAGVTRREYASRVLDMVATVDESLRNIPDSQLKTNLLRAKKAYVDAKNEWTTNPDFREVDKVFVEIMWKAGDKAIEQADTLFRAGRLNP